MQDNPRAPPGEITAERERKVVRTRRGLLEAPGHVPLEDNAVALPCVRAHEPHVYQHTALTRALIEAAADRERSVGIVLGAADDFNGESAREFGWSRGRRCRWSQTATAQIMN
jgi:hypothetical protein